MSSSIEAAERARRCVDYRAAYQAANGKPATVTYERGYYVVNGVKRRAAEVDEMIPNLRRRVQNGHDQIDRMQRVARELGAGWEFKAEYGRDKEPVAQKGWATVYMNGRGYKAQFANGYTTVTDTGASPGQAVANMVNGVELALRKIRLHLDEVTK